MQIRRIVLKNLHSIQSEVEIDFTTSPLAETGLFAITGDTGAGKTTVLDAITLALYGNVCRNSDVKEVLSYGAEEGMALCEFEARNHRYLAEWRIRQTRSKKPENRLKTERSVSEWDEKSETFVILAQRRVREVNQLIEEITGLDFARFTRSVMLAQGEFAAFLKANETERSELLERITGAEIYTQLSKAALERRNIERNKLEELTNRRNSLQIFSREELREKKREFKNKSKEGKTNREVLEKQKIALQWLRDVEKLQQKKDAAEKELLSVEDEIAKVQPELEKLARHAQTVSLQPLLERHDEKEREAEELQASVDQMQQDISELEIRFKSRQSTYEQKRKDLQTLKKEQPGMLKLIAQVFTLDSKIRERQSILQKQQTSLDEWEQQLTQQNQQQKELTTKAGSLNHSIQELQQWLKDHAHLSELSKDLPTVKHIREGLRESLTNRKNMENSIDSHQKKLETATHECQRMEEQLGKNKSKLEKIQTRFREYAPDTFTSNRYDLLRKLSSEIENLNEQQSKFQYFNELNDQYKQALAEMGTLEEELDGLRKEEWMMDQAFLSLVETGEELEKQLQFKKEIYEQQQRIANYEKDRAILKEGEPCPLCFSTHHPFHEHDVVPYVDEAAEEFRDAESKFRKNLKERTQLMKMHVEIAARINQIDLHSNGRMKNVQSLISSIENRISGLFSLLPVGLSQQQLTQQFSGFNSRLEKKKEIRDQLTQLHEEISSLETHIMKQENQYKEIGFQVRQYEEGIRFHQKNLLELDEKFNLLTGQLNKIVDKYGYRFSMDTAGEMFGKLESEATLFADRTKELDNQERQLELTQQALKQVESSLEKVRGKTHLLSDELKLEKEEHKKLTTKRFDLFGEKDPETERERIHREVEHTEQAMAREQKAYEETRDALLVARQSLKSQSQSLEKTRQTQARLAEKLESGLKKKGFASITQLRSALLSPQEVNRIQKRAEKLKQTEIQTRQLVKTISADLKKILQKKGAESTAEELELSIREREAEAQAIQQAIGALKQQLDDNEKKVSVATELLEETDRQRQNYNRWAALYDLIGSSDGKKFRIFAQGLTLQKLVQLANQHLANLNGRYFIVKRSGEDLELDIVDTYQADHIRSMHTLSGGESFLVSLALALGLSDLAGRNANIKSLFIDEGFGTLDDQALDMAISTLENLQAKGKTIGIISHVKELKERISTQVRVVKKGGGISKVEIEG